MAHRTKEESDFIRDVVEKAFKQSEEEFEKVKAEIMGEAVKKMMEAKTEFEKRAEVAISAAEATLPPCDHEWARRRDGRWCVWCGVIEFGRGVEE